MSQEAPSVVAICGKNRIAASGLTFAAHVFAARWPNSRLVAIPGPDDALVDGWQPSMRQAAMRLQIPIVEMTSLQDIPDLVLISLEYSRIVRVAKFKSPNLYNIHFSALPKYRGMYTSVWPILNGEKESGVTFHVMDAGADTGPIISQRIFALPDYWTSRRLYEAYLDEGLELFRQTLETLVLSTGAPKPQDESKMSYYFKSSWDFSRREIDLTKPAEEVSRFTRAMAFPEYQLPALNGRRVKNCRILPIRSKEAAGTVLLDTPISASFAAGDGGVVELQWADE